MEAPAAAMHVEPAVPTGARRRVLWIGLGWLLAFFGAVTLGNGTYLYWGYGPSAFALFVLAFLYPPREAGVCLVGGMATGALLDLRNGSLMLPVAVGLVFLRALEFILLIGLKGRLGLLSASLVALLLGTFLTVAGAAVVVGGSGTGLILGVFDSVYLVPAFLLLRVRPSDLPAVPKALGTLAVVGGTVGAFFSASVFFLPVPFALCLGLLVLGFLTVRSPRSRWSLRGRPRAFEGATLGIGVVVVAALLVTAPVTGLIARAILYPLYPDAWSGSQWMQSLNGPGCRAGNLAGAGTMASGVWSPPRLRVLSTCVTVTGVIQSLDLPAGPGVDADYRIALLPDPGSLWALSEANTVYSHGLLHVEVVPSDQPTVLANLTLVPGEHIRVTGVWVLDTDHGYWGEVHPAWSIVQLPP